MTNFPQQEPQRIFHPIDDSQDNANQTNINLLDDDQNIVVQPKNTTYDYINEIRNSQRNATVIIHGNSDTN
jgi:hypothetical protein